MYNGLGYANKGLPSPYVWAGTDQYTTGKYVADGVFDPNAVDRQLGCAGLLMAMQQTDSSIIFTGKTVTVPAKHVAAGGAIAGGVVVAQQAHAAGASPAVIAAIVIGAVVVAIIAWLILHNKT
jgi:hypothetical protein